MKHRYEATVAALIEEKTAFAIKVYEDLYSKSTRDKMSALPEGWLPSSDNVAVQFGASYERIYFNGYTHGKLISVIASEDRRRGGSLRLLGKHAHGCAKVYDATHALSVAHSKLDAKERDLKTEFEATRRQLEAALNAVTTTKRLIETWPEIAPFASKFDDEKPQLPALPTEQLNKILDLPVAEAA
jgi:hypothetical protein